MEMPRPGERLARLARGGRGRDRPARRRPVHLRRSLPPRATGREPAARRCNSRGPACSSAARAIACCDSSPSTPTAGTRAGRGRPTRTANGSASSTPRAKRSTATRPRCGARSGSTRSSARTSAISRTRFERLAGRAHRPVCSTASDLATFRSRRLVGTVDEVREQVGRVGRTRCRHTRARRRRSAVPGQRPRRSRAARRRRPGDGTLSCYPRR